MINKGAVAGDVMVEDVDVGEFVEVQNMRLPLTASEFP